MCSACPSHALGWRDGFWVADYPIFCLFYYWLDSRTGPTPSFEDREHVPKNIGRDCRSLPGAVRACFTSYFQLYPCSCMGGVGRDRCGRQDCFLVACCCMVRCASRCIQI